MGKASAFFALERAAFDSSWGEGTHPAQQSKVVPCQGLPRSRRLLARGHQLSIGHIRGEASSGGPPHPQQDLLLLFAHHQGPGGQHALVGRHFGQEHSTAGLREVDR